MKTLPFYISIYSDDREEDIYSAWVKVEEDSYISIEEQAEDKILEQEELWSDLMNTHITNYGDYNMDEEDEEIYKEWEDNIGPHAHIADLSNENESEYFNSLQLIIDER